MVAETVENTEDFELKSGSKVCVIGGGPAGSFFSYFFLELEVEVDIIEAKDFLNVGPTGCNHCGGIISESLVQLLSAEGITLPSNVIRRGIDSYVMHTEDRKVKIETPLEEKRIGSVFRGSGPMGSKKTEWNSFDKFLQDLCIQKGANVITDKVIDITYENGRPLIKTKNNFEKSYDLVVAAVGLDNKSLNMHVFLMNIPNLEFGALIPKGDYITLVLLGKEINKELVESFLNSQQVIDCFPKESDLNQMRSCQCYPKINTQTAKYMYGDRFVAIGDSATSKLYKNGIGAAYVTAKAAATTVLFNGVSSRDFEKYYLPACKSLHFDNTIGKIVFLITKMIKTNPFLKRGVVKTVIKEQNKIGEKRHMSTVLWDTFTGSAPYKEIFLRSLKPAFLISLFWNTITSLRNKPLK